MKIVLAHPGVGPFVQQTARALLEADLLASYWTTFADQPKENWRRMLVQLASLAGVNIERELERRAVTEVPATLLRLAPSWDTWAKIMARNGYQTAGVIPWPAMDPVFSGLNSWPSLQCVF